jgi:cysteinyl-tRNA synthetase
MSIEYLGDHFDLHTGGIDHISTHHTNEIAQSEAYLGDDRQWVSYWMHNDFVVMPEGKMAKSEGRVLLLDDLTDAGYHPLAYRHLLVASHYRKPVDFSWDALESARIGLQRLLRRLAPTVALAREMDERPTFERTEQLAAGTSVDKYVRRFHDALWNDLNTPKVLATLYDASRDSDLLDRDLAVLVAGVDSVLQLGLIDLDVATLERVQPEGDEALRVEVTRLVDARSRAREKRDYAAADAIRDELRRQGVAIEDTENGTSWRWTKNLEG